MRFEQEDHESVEASSVLRKKIATVSTGVRQLVLALRSPEVEQCVNICNLASVEIDLHLQSGTKEIVSATDAVRDPAPPRLMHIVK